MNRALGSFLLALAASAAPARAASSFEVLAASQRALASEPAGPARTDLAAALADVRDGAAKIPSAARQAWIDAHLGTFNETVRALGAGAPVPTLKKGLDAAARLNAAASRWEDAREFAAKALALDPDDRDALIGRSRAESGLADYARAYADAERAAEFDPAAAEARAARAAASYGLGNYVSAASDARRALALDPADAGALALLKLCEGREKKGSESAAAGAPRLADSVEREYHGMIQQMNQLEERRRVPAAQPVPDDVARLIASAGAKAAVSDYWGAVADADKALELDPNSLAALYLRAAAHNLIGEYGEAARDATRGLVLSPYDAPLRDARAWAYNRMGRSGDAAADARAALDADPRDAYALANRAYAEEAAGDYAAMTADYKAAAALNPQLEPAYADAARRHDPAPRGAGRSSDSAPPRRAQALSFALVLAGSLAGGLLIAFGVLRARTGADPEPSAPSLPPVLDAAYQLGGPIGQGGMGVVYEAVDRRLKRPVAIKMLRDEFKLDDAAKTDFLAEARTVAELHHPAIVDIHGIVEDERGLYLIFERLEGRTLDLVLEERKRLPLSEIKRVLEPVCAALDYAHSRSVVHRDLKPSNVMLLKDGGVKVLDFGISRHAARAGKAAVTRSVVGTPHYMAPEQEYGVIRRENDVFSLGAVLYEMATGVRPYENAHHAKLAKGYVRASTRVPGLPPALDDLIDRSLEPDPDKRLASPAQFRRLLAAVPDFSALAAA